MIKLTARIVAEYLVGNTVAVPDLPALIRGIHQALTDAGQEPAAAEVPVPAVSIRKSVAAGYVVCLDCGKQFQMLKRHLSVDHDLTPDAYRLKWSLPPDHPLVAPDYAERRSALARKAGLGTRRKTSAPADPGQEASLSAEPSTDRPPAAPDPLRKRSVLTLGSVLGTKPATNGAMEPAADNPTTGARDTAPVEPAPRKGGHRYPANRWAKPAAG